jgi:hypothetical protein
MLQDGDDSTVVIAVAVRASDADLTGRADVAIQFAICHAAEV